MTGHAPEDLEAIRDLVMRYASCADRRDSEGFTALFTDDAVLVGPGFRFSTSGELAGLPQMLAAYVKTYHTVLNIVIDIDGDTASADVYSAAHHLTPVEGTQYNDYVMYITYRDRYRRGQRGWRISNRIVEVEMTQNNTVSIPRDGG